MEALRLEPSEENPAAFHLRITKEALGPGWWQWAWVRPCLG